MALKRNETIVAPDTDLGIKVWEKHKLPPNFFYKKGLMKK